MEFKMLRQRHPEFIYEGFEYVVDGEILNIKYHFAILPDIHFSPTLKIPLQGNIAEEIDNLVFNVGLIEMISYWKTTCSPQIIIKAGKLTDEQIVFWKDLIINGLGEFFYVNKIDFTSESLLSIKVESDKKFGSRKDKKYHGDLVLIGGGKDSAVAVNLIKAKNILLLNPTKAALKITEIARYHNPIIVERTIDPKLLQLNEVGYLNGHTPFSAYLSFLALLVAHLYSNKNIIVSNESSAGEANLNYLGLSVNHQYSKSYEYEKKFRAYVNKYLSQEINYFSFTRPLNELQITALFLQNNKYDLAFNSCNVSRNEYWCGQCAKCAFVYLMFSALTDQSRIRKIFGEKDFFENEKIKDYIKQLSGRGAHKPLDCVGSEMESKMALELIKNPKDNTLINKVKNDWSPEHFLPPSYEKLLKDKIKSIII